jgi:beta-lactamase superfamily II metal-dependent hydrolase
MSAPHHGFDSYEPFAKVVQPEIVVISCGANGAELRAGRTKAAFASVGSTIYVTPWHGAVEIVSDGTTYTVRTERSPSK